MGIDVLSLQKLLGIPVLYFDEIDSTSLYCKERIKSGNPFEGIVIASSQTNGQGRTGKSFYSPKNSGLYVTFSLKGERFQRRNLTPAIAIAACRSIEECFGVSCGVKWVNDIYVGGRKVGGILCQAVQDFVLIGIGINLFQPDSVPSELQSRLGWVLDRSVSVDFDRLISTLYKNILLFSETSDQTLLEEYRTRCVHINADVEIEKDNAQIFGRCVGIDDDFQLLVEFDGHVQAFSSGFMVLKI